MHLWKMLRLCGWLMLSIFLTACASVSQTEAQAVLEQSQKQMGGSALTSIRFAGSGSGTTFGQAYQPGMPWPRINYSNFSRLADYESAAFREDAARTRAEPQGGGAIPLMGQGEQRTSGWMRGGFAWKWSGPRPCLGPWRWTAGCTTCGLRRTAS